MSHFTETWREGRKLVLNCVLASRKIDEKGSVVSSLPSLAEIKREQLQRVPLMLLLILLFLEGEGNRCFNRAMALFLL